MQLLKRYCRSISPFVLIGFIGLTSNCDTKVETIEDFDLVNTNWVLVAFKAPGGSIAGVPQGELYTIQFFDDGWFYGVADCNEYFGQYQVGESNGIVFGPWTSTKLGCGESMFQVYFDGLHSVESFSLKGNRLIIAYNQCDSFFHFVETAIQVSDLRMETEHE